MADRSSPRGGTVPNLRLGTNVAVFLLFFGVSALEALQTRNWLRALLGLAIGVVFPSADNLKRRPEPDVDLEWTRRVPVRVSLTYDAPTGTGRTSPRRDTYRGRFIPLVPDRQVVERP